MRTPQIRREESNSSRRASGSEVTGPGFMTPPSARNRKTVQRRISASKVFLILFIAAIAIVSYVGNVITIDILMSDISKLEAKYQRIQTDQEILRAQINKMSGLEQIQQKAEQELNLKSLRDAPVWISVDHDRIKNLEKAMQEKKDG